MTRSKSLFVTFEGGEGAGKTLLIASLVSALEKQGHQVISTREPGGSELGNQIRNLLLQQEKGSICDRAELLLFLASRAQHVDKLILPELNAGHIVLCDRFNDSTIAYQGAARGLTSSKIDSFCKFATDGLVPDITFLLDIDPEIGLKRIKKDYVREGNIDRIESEKMSFHELVRQGFLDIVKKDKKNRIKVIDASQTAEEVFKEVLKLIKAKLKPLKS